jgi:hypothetical protein
MKRKEIFKQLIVEFHQNGIPDFVNRDLNGLLEAARFLNVKKAVILTFDDFDTLTIDGVEVQILPAYYYFTVLM